MKHRVAHATRHREVDMLARVRSEVWGFTRTFGLATAIAVSGVIFLSVDSIAAGRQPEVTATYSIQLWGWLDAGDFTVKSRLKGGRYVLSSSTDLVGWKGRARSSGTVGGRKPRPVSYRFRGESSNKKEWVKLGFSGGVIKSVYPPIRKKGPVPVSKSHLVGAIDPLSAILALTRAPNGRVKGVNPCKGRIPIFDGKQRFDLKLSYKRKVKLKKSGRSNMPNYAFVCRVNYRPVAGFKRNKLTNYLSKTNGIELWLTPVAQVGAFIPRYVRIPTPWGEVAVSAARVRMKSPGRGQVALLN
ncbi:MAG: DUF3108 domain-containing protein [Hyphomicrobiaceae bacterium]